MLKKEKEGGRCSRKNRVSNPAALRRWIVGGPQLPWIIDEFQALSNEHDTKHDEQKPSIKRIFTKNFVNMVSSMEDYVNQFNENGQDRIALHTKEIMNEVRVVISAEAGCFSLGWANTSSDNFNNLDEISLSSILIAAVIFP